MFGCSCLAQHVTTGNTFLSMDSITMLAVSCGKSLFME